MSMYTGTSNMNLIFDDYLNWQTSKQYDLVIMNPPFNIGSRMILKAANELKEGGTLAFIMQSNWRGYKGKKHNIYAKLNKLGRFESIYMLSGSSETKKLFQGIGGGGIDLVVWKKGLEPNSDVKVRNVLNQEFTYDQSKYPQDAPIIDPIIYDQIFDQFNKNEFKTGCEITTSPDADTVNVPYAIKLKSIYISDNKSIDMSMPKIILSCIMDNNNNKLTFDNSGSMYVCMFGKYIIGDKFNNERIKLLNKLLVENQISTLVHTGCGGKIHYPPFRKEWFEL